MKRVCSLLAVAAAVRAKAATNAAEEIGVPQLVPPYPELPSTFWQQYGLVILVVAVVLVAGVGLAAFLALRRKPVATLPLEVIARKELEALQGQPENAFVLSRASRALRHYFSGAFALPPGELTTDEFCRALGHSEKLGGELSAAVAELLRECDRRKFAPGAAPLAGMVARALVLVQRGEARRQPSSGKP